MIWRLAGLMAALGLMASTGCIRAYATGAMADAMAGGAGVYAEDDDPELVWAAVPFGLKTMESLLKEQPGHAGLLESLAAGFTQYAYGALLLEAERWEEDDYQRAMVLRRRALKLLGRAQGYALRGLRARHDDFPLKLGPDVIAALPRTEAEDVGLLYWLSASLGLAITHQKDDPKKIAELPIVGATAERAASLRPGYQDGAIFDVLMTYEATAPYGSMERAKAHFAAAEQWAAGKRLGPKVGFADTVCVRTQDLECFRHSLGAVLEQDPNAHPAHRLANILMQRRARWLLARVEDRFVGADGEEEE